MSEATRVLLVVDMQAALVEALAPPRRAELLTTLRGLIEQARTTGVPVVYVRHRDEELVPETPPWQIAAEIAPRAGEPVVDKTFRDSFRETDLADVLARLRCDHLVVCGMQTEFCIDATIREAERRGYRVTLAADAHATYDAGGATEEQIRMQMHRVAQGAVAEIVPAAEIFSTASAHA